MRALRVLALVTMAAGTAASQPDPRAADQLTAPARFPDALRAASAYVASFERTFAAVIWRERYLQEVRAPRQFSASGTRFSSLIDRRQLESELFFLWLPRETSWIAVRDVIAVDGAPRASGDRHLQALLDGRTVTVDQLRLLAAQNARFNIGNVLRTFTEPTLTLLFLDDHYRHRFAFTADGEQTVDGLRAARYRFVERARPTVVQNERRDVPARGALVVEPGTGRVLETSLELSDAASGLEGRMIVRYRAHAGFDVLVPVEMRESYAAPGGHEITAVATYSDFRRFETAGRVIVPQ